MKLSEMMESKEKGESEDKKAGKGKCRSIRIERAENGFSISCEMEQKASKKGETSPYVPPETYVFENSDSIADFVKEMMD